MHFDDQSFPFGSDIFISVGEHRRNFLHEQLNTDDFVSELA